MSQLSIDSGREFVFLPKDSHCSANVISHLQQFLDEAPNLKVNESFYFGMWPVKLLEIDGKLTLCEFDFTIENYSNIMELSIRLWEEQIAVCDSQKLSWCSLRIDQLVFYTTNALKLPMQSVTEGIRDEPETPSSTGWFIYTAVDRENDEGFIGQTVGELLKQYNLSILRFLGLPPNWMFNIELSGRSHIWKDKPDLN